MNNRSLKNSLRVILVLCFYLVLFLYAVVFNNSSGWLLLFFLSFLLIGNLISLIPTHKKIHLEMIESSTYRVGHSSQLTLEIFSYRPMLLPLTNLMISFPAVSREEEQFFLAYTGRRKILTFHWKPEERGCFSVLPIALTSGDFLNWLSKESIQQLTGLFPVLPEPEDDLAGKLLQSILMIQPNFYVPFGNRTFMIRDFRNHRAGDPLQLIDWKQSSKRNELVVKEYEQEQEQETSLLFYGQDHPQFEKLLSVYYSVIQQLNGNMTYTTELFADYPAETPEEYILAALQPFSKEPDIPFYTNRKLLIFAPEQTQQLQNQLDLLIKNNEVLLITFVRDQLCLHYNNQIIDIDTMEVTE